MLSCPSILVDAAGSERHNVISLPKRAQELTHNQRFGSQNPTAVA
jgi:hypothetical protein